MEIYHNDAVKVWQISGETDICLVHPHYLFCCLFIMEFSEKKKKKTVKFIS